MPLCLKLWWPLCRNRLFSANFSWTTNTTRSQLLRIFNNVDLLAPNKRIIPKCENVQPKSIIHLVWWLLLLQQNFDCISQVTVCLKQVAKSNISPFINTDIPGQRQTFYTPHFWANLFTHWRLLKTQEGVCGCHKETADTLHWSFFFSLCTFPFRNLIWWIDSILSCKWFLIEIEEVKKNGEIFFKVLNNISFCKYSISSEIKKTNSLKSLENGLKMLLLSMHFPKQIFRAFESEAIHFSQNVKVSQQVFPTNIYSVQPYGKYE